MGCRRKEKSFVKIYGLIESCVGTSYFGAKLDLCRLMERRVIEDNKFVRTKMRLKKGTKIELQRDLSDLLYLQVSDMSGLSELSISTI